MAMTVLTWAAAITASAVALVLVVVLVVVASAVCAGVVEGIRRSRDTRLAHRVARVDRRVTRG